MNSPRRPERAYSILELVVVMAIGSAVLAMAFDLYLEATRLHTACLHYQLGTREVQAWMERLRRDVRQASGPAPRPADLAEEAAALVLARPDGSLVLYRLVDGRAVREVRAGGELLDAAVLVHGVESLEFAVPAAVDRPDLVRFALRLHRRSEHGRIDPIFDGIAAFRSAGR